MEKNQKQSTKVTKSRIKERRLKNENMAVKTKVKTRAKKRGGLKAKQEPVPALPSVSSYCLSAMLFILLNPTLKNRFDRPIQSIKGDENQS